MKRSEKNIWPALRQLDRPIAALAPMDDVTDVVFRQLVHEVAPADLYFTEFASVEGFLGCDSNTANGCETEILANVRHCGACRRACAPSQTCRNGVCR
jgi:tRNA-dihydrouridine synthase